MRNIAPAIAGLFFGAGALIHLARLLCPFDVDIAGQDIPYWASGIVFVVAGLLSAWLFRVRSVV
jgi:hypothetical protein